VNDSGRGEEAFAACCGWLLEKVRRRREENWWHGLGWRGGGIDTSGRIGVVRAVVVVEWYRERGTEWLQTRETGRRLEGEGIRIIVEKGSV